MEKGYFIGTNVGIINNFENFRNRLVQIREIRVFIGVNS
jgi:predicted ATPase